MDEIKIKKLGNFFTFLGVIRAGDVEKVKEMLDQGENVNSRFIDFEFDSEKVTDGHQTISDTDTPLLVAIKSGANPEIVQLLLERGANISTKDENGKTALEIADERKSNGVDIVSKGN